MTIGPKPISTNDEVLAVKIALADDVFPANSNAVDELAEKVEGGAANASVGSKPDAPHALKSPSAARRPDTARTVALGIAGGAVAGGLIAVGVMMLGASYVLPMDPRVEMVERRLGAIEAKAGENGAMIERLNGDIAQAFDSGQAVAASMAEQRQATSTLREELAAVKAGLLADGEKPSPIFAVAVAQLRAAFVAGVPFETELVNVYSLARQDGDMVATLTELLGPARTGVPNATALRRQLEAVVAAVPGLQIGEPQSYYEYGMALVKEYVGYSSTTYAVEFANSALTDADRLLARGDVSGAIAVLADVDASIRRSLTPFLENARLHERVNAAISGINERVVSDLRERKGA